MMRIPLLYLLLPLFTTAFHLQGSISPLPSLQIDSRITVGRHSTAILKSGQFHLHKIESGDYILNVLSRTHTFPQYFISINDSTSPSIIISLHTPGLAFPTSIPTSLQLPHPLIIQSTRSIDYNEKIRPFDWKRALFGNPLILIMVLGGIMAVALPKIMASLDPEILNEVQANQSQLTQFISADNLGNGLSKFLAGASSTPTTTSSPTPLVSPVVVTPVESVIVPAVAPENVKGKSGNANHKGKKRK